MTGTKKWMPSSFSLKVNQPILGDLNNHEEYLAHYNRFLLSLVSTVWAKTPNVIIIMTDDQGYGDLSCHGNPILKTPNLDQLHSESVRFTDFHVSPSGTPTRAALMTGNHPVLPVPTEPVQEGPCCTHRKNNRQPFCGKWLQTGMTGKWHLGDNAPHRPQDRGFQDAVWHRCGGVGQASDHWEMIILMIPMNGSVPKP